MRGLKQEQTTALYRTMSRERAQTNGLLGQIEIESPADPEAVDEASAHCAPELPFHRHSDRGTLGESGKKPSYVLFRIHNDVDSNVVARLHRTPTQRA
jgi:hypothetical protein